MPTDDDPNHKQRWAKANTSADQFHKHLDRCRRCREQPMNLCPVGFLFLTQATADGTEAMTAGFAPGSPRG